MLLSDWYTKWKETRIKEAVEKARAEGYKEGFAVAKSANRKAGAGTTATRRGNTAVVSHGRKGKVVKTARKTTRKGK